MDVPYALGDRQAKTIVTQTYENVVSNVLKVFRAPERDGVLMSSILYGDSVIAFSVGLHRPTDRHTLTACSCLAPARCSKVSTQRRTVLPWTRQRWCRDGPNDVNRRD